MIKEDLKNEIKYLIGVEKCNLDDLIKKISNARQWVISYTTDIVNEILNNDSSFIILNNEVSIREDLCPKIPENQNPNKDRDIKEYSKIVGRPKDPRY